MKIVSESANMMATAFGLVFALAWNEAIKQLISEFLPQGKGLPSLFVYAIIVMVMVIAVVVIQRLNKIKEKFGEEG